MSGGWSVAHDAYKLRILRLLQFKYDRMVVSHLNATWYVPAAVEQQHTSSPHQTRGGLPELPRLSFDQCGSGLGSRGIQIMLPCHIEDGMLHAIHVNRCKLANLPRHLHFMMTKEISGPTFSHRAAPALELGKHAGQLQDLPDSLRTFPDSLRTFPGGRDTASPDYVLIASHVEPASNHLSHQTTEAFTRPMLQWARNKHMPIQAIRHPNTIVT